MLAILEHPANDTLQYRCALLHDAGGSPLAYHLSSLRFFAATFPI
jgi:hypothetical protein